MKTKKIKLNWLLNLKKIKLVVSKRKQFLSSLDLCWTITCLDWDNGFTLFYCVKKLVMGF
jgi:hypothetical protein